MFVIYWSPSDFPERYVVRRWVVGPGYCRPGRVTRVSLSLDEARKGIPAGLVLFTRSEGDDPCIVESYL